MRYKEYKKVDIPWLDEIPSHWKIQRIASVFDIRKEKNDPIKTEEVLSLSAKYGVTPYSEKKEKGGNKPKSDLTKYNLCYEGDILVNCMNVVAGAVGISNYFGAVSPVYYPLVTNKHNNKYYMEYLFRNYDFQRGMVGLGKGIMMNESESGNLTTVRMRISWDTLKTLEIPVPSKEEQEQIARFLDWKINEIDRLIELEKQKINKLEINFTRIINNIFNAVEGERVKLKYIFDFGKGLNITKNDLSENGIKCISYGEIHGKNRFSFSSDDKNLKSLGPHVKLNTFANLNQGDFVFCDTSEDLEGSGNFSYKKDSGLVYASYHTIVAKPRVNFNSEYIAYFFESDLWRAQIRANVKGIKVYSITQLILKDSYIILPDIYTQKKNVKNLNDFKGKKINLTNNISVIIKKLESLKQSLISNVVTGKIDVRNVDIPNYEKVNDIEGAEILEENFEEEV